MSGRQSSSTERAMKLVAKGTPIAVAAKKAGCGLSTLYLALKKLKSAGNPNPI